MDPFTIGLILSAVAGLGTSIYGGIKSSNAAKAQKQAIADYRNTSTAANESWYNRNYYQDYLNQGASGAAIRRTRDYLTQANKSAAGMGAMVGATPEAVAATKTANNKLLTDTISDAAAQADTRKAAVDAQYLQNKNTIAANATNGQMQQLQLDEAGGAQLSANGTQALSNALSTYAMQGTGTGTNLAGAGGTDFYRNAYEREKLRNSLGSLNTNYQQLYSQRFGKLK